MKKLLFILLAFVLLLLPFGFLFGTQWGLQLVVDLAYSMSRGRVTVGSVKGRLATAYTLGEIKITTPGADFNIEKFHWSWRPFSLLQGELDIEKCNTTEFTVQLKVSKPEEKRASKTSEIFQY